MLKIDKYSFERKERKGKRGGGLIVYLSNNVIYKRRHDLEINIIRPYYGSLLVPFELYDAQLDIVDCSILKYYILGDIIINYMINDEVGSFNNSKWSDLVSKFDLTQFITCPTRVNKKSS